MSKRYFNTDTGSNISEDRPLRNHSLTWDSLNPSIQDLLQDYRSDKKLIRSQKRKWLNPIQKAGNMAFKTKQEETDESENPNKTKSFKKPSTKPMGKAERLNQITKAALSAKKKPKAPKKDNDGDYDGDKSE